MLAELACGQFSIRFSGPPFGAHYGSSRHGRLSVPMTICSLTVHLRAPLARCTAVTCCTTVTALRNSCGQDLSAQTRVNSLLKKESFVFQPVDTESSGPLVRGFWNGQRPAAFVGVCLNHRMSTASFLSTFLPWVAERTSRLLVLVFDYLERHNEIVFNGLPESEAAERVMKRGEAAADSCRSALRGEGLAEGQDFFLRSYRDEIETPGYKALHQSVSDAFAHNPAFAEDVRSSASEFVARMDSAKPKRFRNHTPQRDTHRLHEYLLDEIAMYLHLFQAGYTVEVYPGPDSPVLQNIALGKYGIFPEYAERTHVSVTEKGQQSGVRQVSGLSTWPSSFLRLSISFVRGTSGSRSQALQTSSR